MGGIDRLKWIKATRDIVTFPALKCSRCWGIGSIVWLLVTITYGFVELWNVVEMFEISHIYFSKKRAVKSNVDSNEPKWYCSLYLFQSSTEVVYNYYVSFSMFNLTGQLCQLLLLTILMDWMPIFVVSTKDLYYSLFSLQFYNCIFILTFWGNS